MVALDTSASMMVAVAAVAAVSAVWVVVPAGRYCGCLGVSTGASVTAMSDVAAVTAVAAVAEHLSPLDTLIHASPDQTQLPLIRASAAPLSDRDRGPWRGPWLRWMCLVLDVST